MVLHQAFCARHERKTGIGGEVRHGVTSGVSCETSLNKSSRDHLETSSRASTETSGIVSRTTEYHVVMCFVNNYHIFKIREAAAVVRA